MMEDPEELRDWIGRAFETAAALPKKVDKASRTRPAVRGREGTKKPTSKKSAGKKPAAKSLKPTRSLRRK
jgi:hypothetical protein